MPMARRALAPFVAGVVLAACSSSSSPAPASKPTISAPTIWLQRSSSIDPRALPLRDQAYAADGPKQGYVYVCDVRAFQQVGGPGSTSTGPWVDTAAGTYDVTKKVFVQGNVYYDDASFSATATDVARLI